MLRHGFDVNAEVFCTLLPVEANACSCWRPRDNGRPETWHLEHFRLKTKIEPSKGNALRVP